MQSIAEYVKEARGADMDWFPVGTDDLVAWQAEVESLGAIVATLLENKGRLEQVDSAE